MPNPLLLCCRCAALALQSIDRRVLYGQEVRVNWASQRDTRPDTSNHFHISSATWPPRWTRHAAGRGAGHRMLLRRAVVWDRTPSVLSSASHVQQLAVWARAAVPTTSWFACLAA